MFEQSSRYSNCKDLAITVSYDDSAQRGRYREIGKTRVIRYKERRFIPSIDKMQTFQELAYTAGDRLDLITARTLGDPEQFWRICDSNGVAHPLEVTSEPGSVIRIAVPWSQY